MSNEDSPLWLDGKWQSQPRYCSRGGESRPGSFIWDMRCDETAFELAVQVRKDSLAVDPARDGVWGQDHISLTIDARSDRKTKAPWGELIQISAAPVKCESDGQWLTTIPDGPEDAAAETALLDDGYIVIFRVPHRALDEMQSGPWQSARLAICTTNFVGPDQKTHYCTWVPGPHDDDYIPNAGTILREK